MSASKELKDFLKLVCEDMDDLNPTSLAVVCTTPDGEVGVHYFKCDVMTKILYSGVIQQDAMIATLKENNLVPKIPNKFVDPIDRM